MELTPRQKEFTRALLDLWHERQGPVHYTDLAEQVGVSRFTAYDMLRLLEEKGFVTSLYQLPEEKSGPGRSVVVYEPTERVQELMARLLSRLGGEDWGQVKAQLLDRLERGAAPDDAATTAAFLELLERVPPEAPEATGYCVEVMTVVATRLRRHEQRQAFEAYLPGLLHSGHDDCRVDLTLLGGLALAVLATDQYHGDMTEDELLDHVRHYQELVLALEPSLCTPLLHRLAAVFEQAPA